MVLLSLLSLLLEAELSAVVLAVDIGVRDQTVPRLSVEQGRRLIALAEKRAILVPQ